MGIFWRKTMPLLSTLAALVIIVHTAEEEMEYHDVSPRIADPGALDYDQTWKATKTEPMMQKSDDWDENSPEERHRRPGRKRKRRPFTELQNESEERRFYHEESEVHETDYPPNGYENKEVPKQRRKRPEVRTNRWTEESTEVRDRPLRRRGQRRKRPKFAEFDVFRSDENVPLESVDKVRDHPDTRRPHRKHKDHDSEEYKAFRERPRITDTDDTTKVEIPEPFEDKQEEIKFEESRNQRNEDVSLADSSSLETDLPLVIENKTENVQDKSKDDLLTPEFFEKAKIGAIDPMTLKNILKKSNGSSLSEILQQHNLSLADLLRRKQNAVSEVYVKTQDKRGAKFDNPNKEKYFLQQDKERKDNPVSIKENEKLTEKNENRTNLNMENNEKQVSLDVTIENQTESNIPINMFENLPNKINSSRHEEAVKKYIRRRPEVLDLKDDAPKILRKRPLQQGSQRKLRLKPSPINPSLMLNRSLNAKRRNQQMYNSTTRLKSREPENVTESVSTSYTEYIKNDIKSEVTTTQKFNDEEFITETTYEEPATSPSKLEPNNDRQESITPVIKFSVTTTEESTEKKTPNETTEPISTSTVNTEPPEPTIEIIEAVPTTEKPNITSTVKQKQLNRSELRQQIYTNRLKKKRLRQKASTTISPEDDLIKDLFGMANLVSASEFIAKVQTPKSTTQDDSESSETQLEDFMANEASSNVEKGNSNTPQYSVARHSSTTLAVPTVTTTEEIAKMEIEEILNDTDSGARLSKILMERNMTLNELVEHRERGSSQVHLADIFHNTSREPNPPEPFLSKSLIEPISKETYPLRALLEANHHETTIKPTTIEPYQVTSSNNIPIVMNFGTNVNENSENLGIVSMFNKMIGNEVDEKPVIKKYSDGEPYISSVLPVNIRSSTDSAREGRDLETGQSMNLNEIFSFMQRTYFNGTNIISESFTKGLDQPPPTKPLLEDNHNGEGLMVMEDLQHLKEFESNIASTSEEKIEVDMPENQATRPTKEPGFLDKIPDSTKSVTIATTSIVGLTMVVFLMTYAAFRWRQQRKTHRKKESFCDERIPTPVFESRKGNKNQSSMRSISPMLSSNNIYTLNTLDSRTSTETDYNMWDSLRKPFQ